MKIEEVLKFMGKDINFYCKIGNDFKSNTFADFTNIAISDEKNWYLLGEFFKININHVYLDIDEAFLHFKKNIKRVKK